jgi:hypothetical protein
MIVFTTTWSSRCMDCHSTNHSLKRGSYQKVSERIFRVRICLGVLVVLMALLQFCLPQEQSTPSLPEGLPLSPPSERGSKFMASFKSTSHHAYANIKTNVSITIRPDDSPSGRSARKSILLASSTPGPYCLVHVGKTAGGTLSCRFGNWLAKSCDAHHRHHPQSSVTSYEKPSPLPNFVRGKFHKATDWGCLKRGVLQIPRTWLFTLRNPLDRIASWFQYENIRFNHVNEIVGNRPALFQDCFQTLDDLSQFGLQVAFQYNNYNFNATATLANCSPVFSQKKNKNHYKGGDPKCSNRCAKRAWDAVTGRVGYQYHNFYNYRYYLDWVEHVMGGGGGGRRGSFRNFTILVIRSEHIEEDWATLEVLYGGNNASSKSWHRDDAPRRHQSNSSVHPDSYPNLCRALCKEIEVYTWLLEQAINLTPQQRQESLDELRAKCPTIRPCEKAPINSYQDRHQIIVNPSFPKR